MTHFRRFVANTNRNKKVKHELVNGTLEQTENGVLGRCVCGYSTGYRISSMVASAIFADHVEENSKLRGS